MTQHEKNLLIKDLCARLPYGVKVQDIYYNSLEPAPIWLIDINAQNVRMFADEGYQSIEYIKPYLFPLSSMTEEQYYEMQSISGKDCLEHMEVEKEWRNNSPFNHLPLYQHKVIEFFHKHHFDYRGLIPMGLANDATGLNIY